MTTQELEPGICRVLPSGLVLHRDGEELWASRLQSDGSLERITVLDAGISCDTVVAHDPATETLWWVEPASEDGTVPHRLFQLDLASNTLDWQRHLVFDGLELTEVSDLLFHEGALYVGGSSLSGPDTDLDAHRSLLARIDAGQTIWARSEYPGFDFSPENDGSPLNGLSHLLGTSSGISFIGWISGVDSQALTLATVDAQTGELSWSSSLDRDNDEGIAEVIGDGERLYVLTGTSGQPEQPQYGLEEEYAQSVVAAITPAGEEQWRTSEYVWPEITNAAYGQAIVDGSLFVTTVELGEGPRHRIARWSWSSGGLECESPLPEFAPWGVYGISLIAVGDELVLEARPFLGDQRSFALLKRSE